MPVQLKTPPERTIFSINPLTGEPYLSVEYVSALIGHHISTRATHLLQSNSMEDLRQSILQQICVNKFDPERSSAKTFCILMIQCCCMRIAEKTHRKRNYTAEGTLAKFITPEVVGKDGELVNLLETLSVDDVTPEDIMLAKEQVVEFMRAKARKKTTRQTPKGWVLSSNRGPRQKASST